jgi:polyhydroxybutyrate depolymerase
VTEEVAAATATTEIVEPEPTATETAIEEEPSFAGMEVIPVTAAEDIAGTYTVAGESPDGTTYDCFLTITPNTETYTWQWWNCGEFEGIGLRLDNIISVVWGGPECGIVAYRVEEDGRLNGRWTTLADPAVGSEFATPMTPFDAGSLDGAYTVTGAATDGTTYEGTLQVTAVDDIFEWRWDVGGEFVGVAIRQDDIISVAYGGDACSNLSYEILDDGTLNALWTYVGQSAVGTEIITPSDEVAPAPEELPEIVLADFVSDIPADPSEGCGLAPALPSGQSGLVDITVGDLDRTYLMHLPSAYDPDEPVSLLLSFHGYTGTAEGMEESTMMSSHADQNNYIVVYPQAMGFTSDGALITSWNDLSCNASPGPEGPICTEDAADYADPTDCGQVTDSCNWCTCHNDIAYVEQMLDTIEQNYCIDRNRIYATGFSSGGMLTHRLGCDMADRFAAIAPASGTLARGFNCAPDASTSISVMHIHGREDTYVDVTGATSSDGYLYTALDDVLSLWASSDSQSCDADPTPYETVADGMRGLSCTQNANCATGAEVVSCWWDGGHEWPTSSNMFGNNIIWDFLRRHPKQN